MERMLTTIDNEFNYFTQFDDWYRRDHELGHDTLEYLARIAKTSSQMSEFEYNKAVDAAIDEILSLNVTGIYTFCVDPGTPDQSLNPS